MNTIKNILILLALIYILIKSGQSKASEINDLCGRNKDQIMKDNKKNIVCANPDFEDCRGPAIATKHGVECLEITSEEFLESYKKSN